MPSFDIVSRIDLAEVDNAIAGIKREISTRFDFKGSKCVIERAEGEIRLTADDDLKLKQMHELLKVHLTRRKVEPGALDYKPPEKAGGNTGSNPVGDATERGLEDSQHAVRCGTAPAHCFSGAVGLPVLRGGSDLRAQAGVVLASAPNGSFSSSHRGSNPLLEIRKDDLA